MTLGQEFGGYAACVDRGADEIARAAEQLKEVNLGATAVGTGLNAGDEFSSRTVKYLGGSIDLDVVPAANYFRVTQSMGDVLAYSGAMRRLAVEVSKIASDLRLLSMGPRAGLAEIALPAVQPGSSIMPGKVNPSIPEMVNQVCFQVVGCDTTVCMAAEAGQLELNVMMPVIAWNTLHASTILRNAMGALTTRTSMASSPTSGAHASCSSGARRSRRRSARILDTRRPRRSRKNRSQPASRSATSFSSAASSNAGELDRILSVEAMTQPGIAGAKG